jgi:hypothetical protein
VTSPRWPLLLALASLACEANKQVPLPITNDDLCLAILDPASDRRGMLEVEWFPAPGWTQFSASDTAPWAMGPGTIMLSSWVACGADGSGQRLAAPDALGSFAVAFDPPMLAQVTGIRLNDDPWWHREVYVDVDASGAGDGQLLIDASFEGEPVHTIRPFRVRAFADVDAPAAVVGPKKDAPSATLRGGLWAAGLPVSVEHEVLIVQTPPPLPWLRGDGALEVELTETPPSLVRQGRSPTTTTLTWPRAGRTTASFDDGSTGPLDVVEPSDVAVGDVLDDMGQPVRAAVCTQGQELDLQVALTDAQGRAITGGGVLLRSFDLDKARPFAAGSAVTVDCEGVGETTLELVAGQRISVALTVMPTFYR